MSDFPRPESIKGHSPLFKGRMKTHDDFDEVDEFIEKEILRKDNENASK